MRTIESLLRMVKLMLNFVQKIWNWFKTDKSKYLNIIDILSSDIIERNKKQAEIIDHYLILLGAVILKNDGELNVEQEFVTTMLNDSSLIPIVSTNDSNNGLKMKVEKVFNDKL